MTSFGTQFRNSRYSAFYVGHTVPVEFTVYQQYRGEEVGHDLTQYDAVELQFYAEDSDSTLRKTVALTVMTATADKIDGVACRCNGNVGMTGAAGDARVKLAGRKGSTWYILGKPWKAGIYLGGPSTT